MMRLIVRPTSRWGRYRLMGDNGNPREALSNLRFARERSQFRQFRLTPDILVSLSSQGMATRLDLSFLKVESLEFVACFVTVSETKTTVKTQKPNGSNLYG